MSDPRHKIDPQQAEAKFPGAGQAWTKQTEGDLGESDPYISANGELRATDVNGGTYTFEGKGWICHECGTTPESSSDPSIPCHFCNRGPGMSSKNEMGVAGIAGVQAPPMKDDERMAAVREMIRNKVREVVRKKAGGGGYTLYAPNPGKKGGSKPVGNFPTKMGAKRAELARYPPKDPGKLKRLRKDIEKTSKDPKKAAEKEKTAAKQKGTDKGQKKAPKNESVNEAGPFTSSVAPPAATSTSATKPLNQDPRAFFMGLKAIPADKSIDRANYIQNHLKDPTFLSNVKKTPNGDQAIKQLYALANKSAAFKPGQSKTTVQTQIPGMAEATTRRIEFMHRSVLSKIITRSLTESLFREERTESEWDDYISKLSKQALAGDTKFQSLQKNISKRTEGILNDAFNSIKKAVGKDVKLKNFGLKHDPNSGQTYLAFSADFEGVSVEPIYIHIEGGVPRIDVSTNAKVALTKTDPDDAKLFRAELVTVQERVLDDMDTLSKAIQNRDKYLSKLESEVDGYVASLAPLQISLLKQLLVKKYRKIT